MKVEKTAALLAFSVHVASVAPALAFDAKGPETPYAYANIGFIGVFYDESSDVYLAGAQAPGLGLKVDNDFTGGLEFGYRFSEHLAASVTIGLPPTAKVYGNDLLPIEIGSITYGPLVVSAHYHFTALGPGFEPYVGAGLAYMTVFNEEDGALKDLDVDNSIGPVLQFGFESRLDERWGFFADFKKIWLESTATGTINGVPAKADVRIDPFVTMIGVSYRF
ncbi:OmpW/AlkL family protein [Ensifer adhaerens]